MQTGNFCEGNSEGEYSEQDVIDAYIDHIVSDVVLAGSYKVVVDCGGGIQRSSATPVGKPGCDVVPLYCDIDGGVSVPPAGIQCVVELKRFDRSGENEAQISVWRLMMRIAWRSLPLRAKHFARLFDDVVRKRCGVAQLKIDIVFDVKSTRRLSALISSWWSSRDV